MPRVFCAIDTQDFSAAEKLCEIIASTKAGVKLGLEFFNTHGPQGVSKIRDAFPDLPFFLDLKLHDIPNTVAKSVRALAKLQPDYLNVHAGGGFEMMKAAAHAANDEAEKLGLRPAKMIAVTVLTSFDEEGLKLVGQETPIAAQVLRLANLTKEAGMAGVVCSSHEIKTLREEIGCQFVLITPGIRPEGTAANDQKRMMTPKEALDLGATHLVIGRPITEAADPAEAIEKIYQTL